MKAFRFPLDHVRRYRAGQLEAEERAMHSLLERRSSLVRLQEQIVGECRERELAVIHAPQVDGEVIGSLDAYRTWAKRQHQLMAAKIAELDRDVAAQRQRVQSARRDLELLNKLRDRRHREWRKGEDAELESLAAEAFLAKWNS